MHGQQIIKKGIYPVVLYVTQAQQFYYIYLIMYTTCFGHILTSSDIHIHYLKPGWTCNKSIFYNL
jgi:hypothetical protein